MGRKSLTEEELREVLNAHNLTSNNEEAADYLDMGYNKYISRLRIARERLIYNIPDGHRLKGVSTYNNIEEDGTRTPMREWVKTDIDLERQMEMLTEAVEALKSDIKPTKKTKAPKIINDSLLSTYLITDYHIGCLSWKDETGEEWNTELAEDMLVAWFERAINSAPDAHTAIFAQLGDFLHYDSLTAITPTSGNVLDTDTRYQNIVKVAVRAVRRIITMLLKKHQHVHILMCEGNHDLSSSVWLRSLFEILYEKEPRITVDNTHSPFYAYEWGKTSLFFHHGHKVKMGTISATFAGIYRDIFGRTKYSYAHMGHMHHKDVKENSMMIVEQHPTLAAKDAYSTRGGYISQRGACVITYSKLHGEISRAVVRPEMVM